MAGLAGTRMLHYHVLHELGAGGMGEVYLAQDEKLGRAVALKVLPADLSRDTVRLERFELEARAIAALNHPNIVTIHSIEEANGVHFITLEWIEGETLGERIPEGGLALGEFFDIAVPLCDAVSAAHQHGITHGDLKPSNVMMTREGRVKILDFGLARLHGEGALPCGDEETTAAIQAEHAGVFGTVPYMSPEHVQGRPVDHCSDIFSLGIVLYEMVTGRRPFQGGVPAELFASILRDAPISVAELRPDLPHHMGRIIRRCLEKDPQRRCQTALDLRNELEDLRRELDTGASQPGSSGVHDSEVLPVRRKNPLRDPRLGGSSAATGVFDRPAVAVLPFTNMSGEQQQEYFVDGITEDIVTSLSYWRWFPVIARNSTLVYKDKPVNVSQVGEELGARYVLGGSVRKAGGRVRVTAQLADAATGHHIWAERYDRDLSDIFALQDEISERIVTSIEPELHRAEQQRALRKKPENLDAWDYCLRALSHQHKHTQKDLEEALRLLRRAIELEPGSSQALSLLAYCHYKMAMAGWSEDRGRSFEEVFRTAKQAVASDDEDWLAHTLKGAGYLWTLREHDLAVNEMERAIALNPSAATGYHFMACFLEFSGRSAEAIPQLHTVLRLDPRYQLTSSALADLALSHLMLREFEESTAFAEKAIRALPGNVRAYQRLASCLGHLGREKEARATMAKLLQRQPDLSVAYIEATYPYKNPEHREFLLAGLYEAGLPR